MCLSWRGTRQDGTVFVVCLLAPEVHSSVPPGHTVLESVGVLSITNMPKPFHVLLEKRY